MASRPESFPFAQEGPLSPPLLLSTRILKNASSNGWAVQIGMLHAPVPNGRVQSFARFGGVPSALRTQLRGPVNQAELVRAHGC